MKVKRKTLKLYILKKSTWTIFKIVFLGVAYLEEIHLDHLQRMSGELEEQADELLALSTIVDARAFNHTGTQPHRGSLEVQVC